MCCASLGFLLTLTPWLALGRDPPLQQPRELTLYPAPPTSLGACAGSPAVRITGLCRHVSAAGRLPGGLWKTWHLEKSLECTAGTLLGRT